MPPNSSPGSVVESSIAPPMVLRPNSVPCGPRSTCTFEMSRSCIEPPMALPMYTSSMYMPTPGSTVEVGSVCPMPRMNTCEEELLPASGALLANCRFGTTWSSTSVENICRSSSAAPESAVIEIGVVCRFSSTLRAVTMISSRPSASWLLREHGWRQRDSAGGGENLAYGQTYWFGLHFVSPD